MLIRQAVKTIQSIGLLLLLSTCDSMINPDWGPKVLQISPTAGRPLDVISYQVKGSNLPTTGIAMSIGGEPCSKLTSFTVDGFTATCTVTSYGSKDVVVTAPGRSISGTLKVAFDSDAKSTKVTSITPLSGAVNFPITFSISGINLPMSNQIVEIGGEACSNVTNATPVAFDVTCTVKSPGIKDVVVKSGTTTITDNPTLLKVEWGHPIFGAISPLKAARNQLISYTVSGQFLPLNGITLEVGGENTCKSYSNQTLNGFNANCISDSIGPNKEAIMKVTATKVLLSTSKEVTIGDNPSQIISDFKVDIATGTLTGTLSAAIPTGASGYKVCVRIQSADWVCAVDKAVANSTVITWTGLTIKSGDTVQLKLQTSDAYEGSIISKVI